MLLELAVSRFDPTAPDFVEELVESVLGKGSGIPEIRFHSGGTAPSAFNLRSVAALQAISVEVQPTGDEAERGDPKTENPIYCIAWSEDLETLEFSKHYADASNPQNGFAALVLCSEADEGCPFVKGATLRVSMPYLDQKFYDDGVHFPQIAEVL